MLLMIKSTSTRNPWEKFPVLNHLSGDLRDQMEVRRRHRAVRYGLFSLQTALEAGRDPMKVEISPGFVSADFAGYFLSRVPVYAVDVHKNRVAVPANKVKKVEQLGGFQTFAAVWDVDDNLTVYIRHASIHQEWNARLMAVVPVLGE